MILDSTGRLAVDRTVMETYVNARIHTEQIDKYASNPVIRPDRPWEEDVHIYGSVLYIDGKYHIWYFARCEQYDVKSVCYARSDDGIHWEKPALGVISYHGEDTNIVLSTITLGERFKENSGVIYTPEDTGREYKMLCVGRAKPEYNRACAIMQADALKKEYERLMEANAYRAAAVIHRRIDSLYVQAATFDEKGSLCNDTSTIRVGHPSDSQYNEGGPNMDAGYDPRRLVGVLYVCTSSDGIHWTYPEKPSCPDLSDISHMFYDSVQKEYVVYGRTYAFDTVRAALDENDAYFEACAGRAIGMTRSKDGISFPASRLIYTSDAFDRRFDEIYSMTAFNCCASYLGLVQMYHGDPTDMTQDIQLAISADGEHFERMQDRTPIIPLGGIGEWDRFNTCMADAPVEVGDEVRLYFNGALFRHPQVLKNCPDYTGKDTWKRLTYIGFGSIKKDRYVCVEASFDGGTVKTKPIRIRGNKLILNCASEFGELIVNIAGCDSGKELTSVICENSLRAEVPLPEWVQRENVRISFLLKNAKLYTFKAEA